MPLCVRMGGSVSRSSLRDDQSIAVSCLHQQLQLLEGESAPPSGPGLRSPRWVAVTHSDMAVRVVRQAGTTALIPANIGSQILRQSNTQ